MISQGDIYWAELPDPVGSGIGYRRPCVVVQSDLFNRSRLRTVIVCPLTSNLQLAKVAGNVLLKEGEGRLPHASVASVSDILDVDRVLLLEKIGTLPAQRVVDIIEGIELRLRPVDLDWPEFGGTL